MTKEVFGVQMSEFTSVLERNQALFFDQVPNDEHDALSYCCEDSDYAVQHYLYWDEVAKQISNDNEVYPTYSIIPVTSPSEKDSGWISFVSSPL